MKKIRIGILGQGRSGYDIHAANLLPLDDKYTIDAVCDPLIDRTNEMAERGARAYSDYKELLKNEKGKLDIIINATPSHLHVPITLEIIDAGYNVLCEKPFARRASEVDAMIEKSKQTGKFLAVFQQSRFAPYFTKVQEIINSGVLGRIIMVKVAFNGFARRYDWQTLQEFNGGNLLNTGPHPLDQALKLFGEGMPNVLCVMDRVNTFGNAEDHVKLILTGEGHPTIDLEISSCCAYSDFTYHIYAERGGLKGNMIHLDWQYYKPEEAPDTKLIKEPLEGRKYPSEKLQMHQDSWDMPEELGSFFKYMAQQFYVDLYEVFINGKPLLVPLEDVRRQIAVIEECHRQNPMP